MNISVGSSTNLAASAAMSGDVTIDNAGATTISTLKVTTAKNLDANVTTAKLANNAVTTDKILDANVTTANLANDAVTTLKIADGNLTNAKLLNSSFTINGNTVALGGTATITASPVGTALTSGNVLVGSASNVAAAVALSGDATTFTVFPLCQIMLLCSIGRCYNVLINRPVSLNF